jgi:hypothetical protein
MFVLYKDALLNSVFMPTLTHKYYTRLVIITRAKQAYLLCFSIIGVEKSFLTLTVGELAQLPTGLHR